MKQRVLLTALVFQLIIATMPALAGAVQHLVDDNDTVVLSGNVHPLAVAETEIGRTDPSLPMERMILVLAMRPENKAALDRLLADQQDPGSPSFHQSLTPEEFGARFGATPDEIGLITGWLRSHGFVVDEVGKGRTWINFTGTVGDVETAFHTQIHDYLVDGELHQANAIDPAIPRALSGVVAGIVSLHDFRSQQMGHVVRSETTMVNGEHWLSPADFATIYNVNSLYAAGITGAGQTVAVVGRSNMKLSDVQFFRSFFNLPSNDPQFIINGPDPGITTDEGEADLDVEWAGAVAPNATIKMVISKSIPGSTDGAALSAQYIVNNNLAPIMTMSFGVCESALGSSSNSFYNLLWSQAAVQNISVFVASGDGGASDCDDPKTASTGSGRAVNGICSTPYSVGVGGTQFMDTADPGAYWSSTNNPTTQASALSYIPEQAWNESGNVSGGSGIWSTGGGVSTVYAKPAWQVAPGVPSDGARDVPDVALSASGHNSYIVIQEHTPGSTSVSGFEGTSAAAPSFAGLMALIVQKTGQRQGNPNTRFYQLGNAQYTGSGPAVFHDVTTGNNSVPGVTGFSAGTGYDLTTGLGSVDATALANNWVASGGGGCGSSWAQYPVPGGSPNILADVVWTGSQIVAVGPSGGMTSSDGVTWTSRSVFGNSIAWTGSQLVAVGGNGRIMTSPDGVVWTSRTSGASEALYGVAWTGSQLVAVGLQGTILTSPDGITWTTRSSGTSNDLYGVAGTGAGVVAVGLSGTILTSPDGATWSIAQIQGTLQQGIVLFAVTAGPDKFVAVGNGSMILTSPDGVTWTINSPSGGDQLDAITWTGTQYVAVGLSPQVAPILTSPDGVDWTRSTLPTDLGVDGITWTGSELVVVGGVILTSGCGALTGGDFSISVSPEVISLGQGDSAQVTVTATGVAGFDTMISLDTSGIPSGTSASFNPVSIPASGTDASTLTLSASDSTRPGSYPVWIVGSAGGATHSAGVMFNVSPGSGCGANWASRDSGTVQTLYSIAWTGSKFVAVGSRGTTLLSPDGVSWVGIQDTFFGMDSPNYIIWAGSQLVALGGNGMVHLSPDGLSWRDVQPPGDPTSVVWTGQMLVAANGTGTDTSPDGLNWSYNNDAGLYSEDFQLRDIVWTGFEFVAVAFDGGPSWAGVAYGIATSVDAVNWTIRVRGLPQFLDSVAWTGSMLVAVGYNGTILTSIDAGVTWTSEVSGTNVALYKVIWTGSQLVAVGDAGTILTSPDGVTWTSRDSGTTAGLSGVVWANTQLVVVGAAPLAFGKTYDAAIVTSDCSAKSGRPGASFTFAPSSPLVGQSVQFTDTSSGSPTSWSWSFGDGASSTTQNPSHAFASTGTYTVGLSASNGSGASSTSQQVTVITSSPPGQTPFSATYDLPGTLTVISPGGGSGISTYGISGEVTDHQFDGKTITITNIGMTANGNAIGIRVNFDWDVWVNNGSVGLTPGGAQTTSGGLNAITTPTSYTTGLHFTDGNVLLPGAGAFSLGGSYNFQTLGLTNVLPAGSSGGVVVATSNPTQVTNGLNLQVAGWSGDGDTTKTVDFTMSGIQVAISGFASAPACSAPTITTQPQSQTIQSSQSANLSVAASGSAPLAYQWYQGSSGDTGSPVGGATSATLNTGPLTATVSGWVRVSNACGHADSVTATITVTGNSGHKAGDCNGDGTVSATELQQVVDNQLGITNTGCGDCSGSGVVSGNDLQMAVNCLLGLPSCVTTCIH